MATFDAIVVGGGPGGSTVAWRLASAGARTLVVDAARFPRVKLCAGWVTRRVMADLELDPGTYPATIQPFSVATLELEGGAAETAWHRTVSYGIVRKEFDHFLVERARVAGATVREGLRVGSVESSAERVVVETSDGRFTAPLVIGAGGHHCPVARAFGDVSEEEMVVVTRESETRLGSDRLAGIAPRPGVPELFPEPDLAGYGWYFAKGDWLNVGIGALDDGRGLHRRERAFLERLVASRRLPGDLPLVPFRGHAYAIRARGVRRVAGERFFLVGDAAGLARPVSGEGIGPAVASGRRAAEAALHLLDGGDRADVAEEYRRSIAADFGAGGRGWLDRAWDALPLGWRRAAGRFVCSQPWLRRRLVFEAAFGMG